MKKTKLAGLLVLSAALVFGAASLVMPFGSSQIGVLADGGTETKSFDGSSSTSGNFTVAGATINYISGKGYSGTPPTAYANGIRLYANTTAANAGGFMNFQLANSENYYISGFSVTNGYSDTCYVGYVATSSAPTSTKQYKVADLTATKSLATDASWSVSGLEANGFSIVNAQTTTNKKVGIASVSITVVTRSTDPSISMSSKTYSASLGETFDVSAALSNYSEAPTVTWSASPAGFVSFSDQTTTNKNSSVKATVIKHSENPITISATSGSTAAETATATLNINAISVNLSTDSLKLGVNKTKSVSATVSGIASPTYKWSVADDSIVSISGSDTGSEVSFASGEEFGSTSFSLKVYNGSELVVEKTGTVSVIDLKTYSKLTDASKLKAGQEILIVDKDSTYALNSTQNSKNRSASSITLDNGKIVESSEWDITSLTLGGNATDGWSLYDSEASGYLYAASSTANKLCTQTTNDANGLWNIKVTSAGAATITAKGGNSRNNIEYNYNGGSPIFSCYDSTTSNISVYYWRELNTNTWADDFLAATASACEAGQNGSSASNALKAGWADAYATYGDLKTSDKNALHSATADVGGDKVAQALARYDYIVAKYGSDALGSSGDYLNRSSGASSAIYSFKIGSSDSTNCIIVISMLGFAALGTTFLFAKKRKEN